MSCRRPANTCSTPTTSSTSAAAGSASPLLAIDPVARRTYEHLEYKPLVNARAHALGKRRQIVNDRFYQQYHRLLRELAHSRQLSDDDLLAVTYYLLLQDRIEEALDTFGAGQRRPGGDEDAVRLLRGLPRLLHRRARAGPGHRREVRRPPGRPLAEHVRRDRRPARRGRREGDADGRRRKTATSSRRSWRRPSRASTSRSRPSRSTSTSRT